MCYLRRSAQHHTKGRDILDTDEKSAEVWHYQHVKSELD